MADFERFDICLAHQALENDWNQDGFLRYRPTNMRKRESTGVQLMRMGFRAGMGEGGTFDALEDNAKEIYVNAIVSYKMTPMVRADDTLGQWILKYFVPEYIQEHFPQLLEKQNG